MAQQPSPPITPQSIAALARRLAGPGGAEGQRLVPVYRLVLALLQESGVSLGDPEAYARMHAAVLAAVQGSEELTYTPQA